MNSTSVNELVVQVSELLLLHGYSPESVDSKRKFWRHIANRHEEKGDSHYNPQLAERFARDYEERYKRGEIQRAFYLQAEQASKHLTDFFSTGALNFARRGTAPQLPDYYESILIEIRSYGGWNEKTQYRVWNYSRRYFRWLDSKGFHDLGMVSEAVIRRYFIDCSSHMSSSYLDTTRIALKKLCEYLQEAGIGNGLYDNILSLSIPVDRKIHPAIPQAEVAATLSVIDRDTGSGKRDYATILLAAVTGLRSVDIVNLKMDDVDWRNGEIKITQSKTGNMLALPLTTDVGMAMQDYILNARQPSGCSEVFLRFNAPVKKLTVQVLYSQHNYYRRKAGLPDCPIYGLRRAVASNMVKYGVSITTVSQMLGHSGINATKQYISLDRKRLKDCALDFAGIEPKVE